MEINQELATKVLSVVDTGLVKGVGNPVPGQMCVEAAVNYALGAAHGDNPSCVGSAVRAFKITLNDANWSSDSARTKGMRKLAIAQLGSDRIDQAVFVKELVTETIKRIVPVALRAAAAMANAEHKDALEAAALRCEQEGTKDAAAYAATEAAAANADAAKAAAEAAAYAADAAKAAKAAAEAAAAAYAAYAAAEAADAAYAAYAAAAKAAAAYAAYAAAKAAAEAAAYAAYAEAAYAFARDDVLLLMATIGLEALKNAGSPGCEFLFLTEAA